VGRADRSYDDRKASQASDARPAASDESPSDFLDQPGRVSFEQHRARAAWDQLEAIYREDTHYLEDTTWADDVAEVSPDAPPAAEPVSVIAPASTVSGDSAPAPGFSADDDGDVV